MMQPITATARENGQAIRAIRATGEQMFNLIADLYPICRSITGAGTMETLKRLQEIVPLSIYKIPTGTRVFDWEVPDEWNIRDAWIKNSKGEKIIDFNRSNLHVVNYSPPVHLWMSLADLKEHLHSSPEHPDWIPYRTTYYSRDWGFCLAHNQLTTLEDDRYEVFIDASLEPGHLAYGELLLKGETSDEVLISTHVCHPSLCNDNLSGISVTTFLARYMQNQKHRYSYRFLFIPGTIGAIAWLSINERRLKHIRHGLVAALLGDPGSFTYKKSRQGDAEIDTVVEYVLQQTDDDSSVREFSPYGYDERQFCSPGINLPVGCLSRTPYGEFPEYHTSADNLDLVRPEALKQSLDIFIQIMKVLEVNRRFVNLKPKGEPRLGKYGLYDPTGGHNNHQQFQLAMLWVLNLSDGTHSLMDIARRSALSLDLIASAADKLEAAGLLGDVS